MLEARFVDDALLNAELGESIHLDVEPVNMSAERVDDGVLLTITDVRGTSEALIKDGQRGEDGERGADGYTPIKGVDYVDGRDGRDGVDGKDYIITPSDYDAIADVTKDKVNLSSYATKTYVDDAIEGLELVEIVTALPSVGQSNKTYLVAKSDGAETDLYDEYLWINGKYELIGSKTIKVDLDDYVKATDWANGSRGGVFVTSGSYAVTVSSNGYLQTIAKTYAQYESMDSRAFIGKGTLENVLDGKGYITEVPTQSLTIDFEDLTSELALDCFENNIPLYVKRDNWLYRMTGGNTSSTSSTYYFSTFSSTTNRYFILTDGVFTKTATIAIPTNQAINNLIDAKLGVIENGSY